MKKQHRLVETIDPGGVCGHAIVFDKRLVFCQYGSFEKIINDPRRRTSPGLFMLEIPRAYPGPKSKQDPNDMVRNALRGGEFKYKYRSWGYEIEELHAQIWKGTIPKPASVEEQYLMEERVLERLDAEERKLLYASMSARAVKLDHNMVDAVGMALWRVGRRR